MPDTEIKVLLLVGGPHHDKEGAREALLAAIQAGAPPGFAFDIELTDDLDVLASTRLREFHVIANYTTSQQLTPEQAEGLIGAVQSGTGFVGIHNANVTFRETEAYNELVGSIFLRHPRFGDVAVRIIDRDHPITRGLADFTVPDELYVIQAVGSDFSRYHVLATAEATGREDPAELKDGMQVSTYLKEYGKGRVFYTGLGHDARCFVSESFRALVGRGIVWAAGHELKG